MDFTYYKVFLFYDNHKYGTLKSVIRRWSVKVNSICSTVITCPCSNIKTVDKMQVKVKLVCDDRKKVLTCVDTGASSRTD